VDAALNAHGLIKVRIFSDDRTAREAMFQTLADELGATKIALGHHRDDILQTFFLNLFHGGKLKSMPPKLVSDDGRHMVIRPLAYVKEDDLDTYAQWRNFPIIPCTLFASPRTMKDLRPSALIARSICLNSPAPAQLA
jgi:tRNA 2-thiocytidine biosynthesis protein TtcA